MRRPLTRAQRVRIFDRAKGKCHLCGLKIRVGERWEVEHARPLWLDGDDKPENMAPAHIACHQEKTSAEATDRAKTDARRANHLGVPKPGKKLPAGRNSVVRKKLNGQVVIRTTQAEEHQRVMAQRQIGGEAQ